MNDLPKFDDGALATLLDSVSDGVAVAEPGTWRLVYANSKFAGWLGTTSDTLRDSSLEELFCAESRRDLLNLGALVCQRSPAKSTASARLKLVAPAMSDAEVRLCRLVAGGQVLLGVVVRRFVPLSRSSSESAERRDPLTGLADREFLLSRMAALLRGERTADRQFAVLFVDLDNFKQVNDAHGHLMGDRVLREVARRLVGCLREGDHVVRYGGDEFVVLVEGIADRQEIDPVIRRIHAALERPVALPEGEFVPSLSIGVAIASSDHLVPEDLLRDADRAMYAAKREHLGIPEPRSGSIS